MKIQALKLLQQKMTGRKLSASTRLSMLFLLGMLTCSLTVLAQTTIRVKGHVTNESGQAIANASVLVKGTTTGANADQNGNFEISAPPSATLVIYAMGYSNKEVNINQQQLITIKLSAADKELGEVVVVGYGTQRKKDITGSVISVSAAALQEVPAANLISELKGRAAGVDIVSNSTSPGASGQIRIRGNRQMATSAGASDAVDAPLLVVDGIPYGGSINDLNPDDISNIDILKDASATAIYGSRGAGGVILVTTKRGKPGKAVMTYSGYYGFARATDEYRVFNGNEYAAFKEEARLGNSVNPGSSNYGLSTAEQAGLANGTSTDWQKLIYRQGYTTSHELSLSGGSESTRYSLSGGFFREAGIIPGQDYTRYSLRSTIDHQINRKLKIGLNTLNTLGNTNSGGNPVGGLLRMSPLAAPYNTDGSINMLPLIGLLDASTVSPLTILNNPDAIMNKGRRLRTFNSLYGEWEIIRGLKYRLNVGLDYRQEQTGSYFGPNTFYNNSTNLAQASSSVGNSEAWTYTIENLLTYDKTFKEKHRLTLTGLFSTQKDHAQSSAFAGTGMPADYIQNYNLALANSVVANPGSFSERGLVSYMGRLNYVYDNRFMLTATLRRDGGSVLSEGHQYFTYPAIGLGWNISNETFMKDIAVISSLKLRAGWGKTANQGINPYATLGGLSTNFYNFGATTAGQNIGYYVNNLANRELGWASTDQVNIGLDFGVLQNRITGSIEIYSQKTKDILLNQSLPPSNGATTTIVNAGKTKGHGVEVTLSSINIRQPNGFTWTTDLNFAFNREEIVALQDPSLKADIGNGWFVGQPLSVIYDVKKIGIWQTKDAVAAAGYGRVPGQIRVEDINNDGKIDANDRQIIGNFQPDWTGGLTNRVSYKGFDLSVVMFARMGMTVVAPYVMADGGANGYPFFNNSRVNSLKRDYWTPANPTDKFPRPDAGADGFIYSSTLGYQDGSFIKVRSINLGYTIPSKFLARSGVSSLRVYVTAQNPFILYSPFVRDGWGIDPEGNGYGGVSTSSVGGTPVPGRAITVNLAAPPTHQFNVGVNLKF